MSRLTVLFVLFSIVAGVNTAWAQKVKTDYDPSVDFSRFKTYYWAKTNPIGNDLMDQRIVAAVDLWLTARGWTRRTEDQADVAVVPHVATEAQPSISTFYDGWAGGWGFGGWGGVGSSTTTVSTVTQGTMMIDLFDRQTKKLVWRGIATGTVSDDPKKNAGKIQKAAEKMFKSKFPPGVRPTTH